MNRLFILLLFFILGQGYYLKAQTLNYYFGNIHAHTAYSDGNKDSATSGIDNPLESFNYAKNSQHIDFYGICEHNHFAAGMQSPAHYHQGLADADSATVDGTFVAMYGMEWGVISGGGHVIVYGYDSLMGWDYNDYDVFVAQNDYASLWKKINEKPGAIAYLAHPQSSDYSNLFSNSVNLLADNAIVGSAARSGPAFSTNTSYSDPSTSNFISRYNDALKRGYHLGVGLDHDTHYTVFGRQSDSRMVVMAPSLTRADILTAIRKMRFYSSDDWNAKVSFTISNMPMGSIFQHYGSPTIKVKVTDPNSSDHTSSIAIYYGVPGSGSIPTVLTTSNNTDSMSYTHSISNNTTYYYYLKITQTDGDIIWTSPIWYTRNNSITNTPPVAAFSFSSNTVCAGQTVNFIDNSTNSPTDWSWSFGNAVPPVSYNQNGVVTFATAGTYTVSLTTSNAYGTSNTATNVITVNPPPIVSVMSDTICKGVTDTLVASGASTYSWNNGATGSTIYVSPITTTQYTVTGTSSEGCSQTANAIVWVEICTGIDEIAEKEIKIFPNPASSLLTVDVGLVQGQKSIVIVDMQGRKVWTGSGTEAVFSIDLSNYENGNYILHLNAEGKTIGTKEFIIQRK